MTDRALRMLYRELPAMACRPGCSDCCGPVPWSPAEWARVADEPAALTARRVPMDNATVAAAPDQLKCPFATAEGCSVYDRRPFICRLFGTAKDVRLTCPHGCGPRKKISAERAASMRHSYREAMEKR